MHIRQPASTAILLIAALALAGCDLINGDQKNRDAEAIGYACRFSQKAPEVCMKENEAQSPTSILKGWKDAEREISSEEIDPNMGKKSVGTAHSAPVVAESEGKAAVEKGAEKAAVNKDEKPAATAKGEKSTAAVKDEAAAAKGEKPAAPAADKSDKGTAEKKASH